MPQHLQRWYLSFAGGVIWKCKHNLILAATWYDPWFTNYILAHSDRLQEMAYTTTITSDTYVISSYSCLPLQALVNFTTVELVSSILMLLENQIGTDISLPKVIITRTTGSPQTVTQTVQEVMTAGKHRRRWKGLHGSPSHTHIKSSSKDKPIETTTSAVTKDTTTSSISKDKDTSSTTSPTATTSASCTSLGPDATDTPASRDKDTGLLFRSSCGASDATVSECPYLCSQAGGGPFRQCSDEDFTGQPPGIFPPAVCSHCLPPCKSDASGAPTTTSEASTTSVLASSIATAACTVFNPFLEGDFPSVRDNVRDTHGLLRFACGQTAELESECPYLCGSKYLSIFLSDCSDTDIGRTLPDCDNPPFCTVICEHCNATTIQPKPSSTCMSIDPSHPTCPPVVNDNDPTIRYQTACGNTTEAIAECPYLCTGIPLESNFHCEQSDVSGTIADGSSEFQACHKCLPVCESAV